MKNQWLVLLWTTAKLVIFKTRRILKNATGLLIQEIVQLSITVKKWQRRKNFICPYWWKSGQMNMCQVTTKSIFSFLSSLPIFAPGQGKHQLRKRNYTDSSQNGRNWQRYLGRKNRNLIYWRRDCPSSSHFGEI